MASGVKPGGMPQVTISVTAVGANETTEFGDAVVHVAHHPSLGDVFAGAEVGIGFGEETTVKAHAVALRLAHGRPIPLRVVGHQHALDDAHSVRFGTATRLTEFPAPDIQSGAAVALGQQVAVEAGGAAGASGRHGGHPKRRTAFLHEARE